MPFPTAGQGVQSPPDPDCPHRYSQADIGQLLPVPAPGAPVQDVINFRHRYDNERLRLITAIGDLQDRLAQWTEDPRDVLAQVSAELAAAERDLELAGTAAKMKWINRGMYVFIAVAAATSTAAVTSLLQAPGLVLSAANSILSVGGGLAVNLATNQIATAEAAQPYSYLHLIRKHLS